MPYQANQPRFEFNQTDRDTLAQIAESALSFQQSPPLRSEFDNFCSQILGLTPTYNPNWPLPDVI